jgi:hypothetical protein
MPNSRDSKRDGEDDRRYLVRGVDEKASQNWVMLIPIPLSRLEFGVHTGLSIRHVELKTMI